MVGKDGWVPDTVSCRVGKNPGFKKKPARWVFFGFYWVLLGIFGFYWVFKVFV
jgi:hypothetical protein